MNECLTFDYIRQIYNYRRREFVVKREISYARVYWIDRVQYLIFLVKRVNVLEAANHRANIFSREETNEIKKSNSKYSHTFVETCSRRDIF